MDTLSASSKLRIWKRNK